MVGGLAGFVLGNIDRIMINQLLGTAEVGIYAAYLSASMGIVGPGLQVFMNVFFPAVSKYGSHDIVAKKVNNIFRFVCIPLTIFTFFLIWFIIFLYGHRYPKDFLLMFLFAINTSVFLLGNIKWWLIASVDLKAVRFTSFHALVAAGINASLNFVLISTVGLPGAILATIVASSYFIILSEYYFKKRYGRLS